MIVKNEERNLADCLRCIADLVDEMVIVDTGSTDSSREIAVGLGARVFDFPWVESFAAARNESLRHARGRWIFWLDADDRIDEENRVRLRELFAGLQEGDKNGYLMHCLIVPASGAEQPRIVDHTRLFPNHPQVRFKYRVHEQILPAVRAQGGTVAKVDIIIRHLGYQDDGLRAGKLQRNLRLLQLDDRDQPNDAFIQYNLGRIHERLGKIAEAVPYWRCCLALCPPTETYVPKLYALLAQGYRQLGQRYPMLTMVLGGLAHFPDQPELLYLAGVLLHEARDLSAAEVYFKRLLAAPRGKYFALGDDVGLTTSMAKHLLAKLYRDMKRPQEAEMLWRESVAENPTYAQAWLGVGQVLLDQARFDELDQVVSRLEGAGHGGVEAVALRGLKLIAQSDIAGARRLSERACMQFPTAIEPRLLLSRILLSQRDMQAAETVLREILKIDPSNGEAIQIL